ncbi:hypothetical protein AB0L75_12280 [Streptomyces sp. NPDC052101]
MARNSMRLGHVAVRAACPPAAAGFSQEAVGPEPVRIAEFVYAE